MNKYKVWFLTKVTGRDEKWIRVWVVISCYGGYGEVAIRELAMKKINKMKFSDNSKSVLQYERLEEV